MKPYCKTDNYTLYLDDAWAVLDSLAENSIDAIVTDPPYEIGFMNKGWDNTGVAFDKQTWQKALRVLKPGGHLLAFNHSRTFHRMAVAIEDAGFEIRDTIMWLYGSGFPKSHDISKAIDKRGGQGATLTKQIGEALQKARTSRGISKSQADLMFCDGTTNWTWFEGRPTGQRPPTPKTFNRIIKVWQELKPYAELVAEAEREVVGQRITGAAMSAKQSSLDAGTGGTNFGSGQNIVNETAAATDEAKQWEGWGTALKPAYEPILLARKPIPTTVADNVLQYGTGAINIDGCRVGERENEQFVGEKRPKNISGSNVYGDYNYNKSIDPLPSGRFPANVIHDGSEEVVQGFPDTKGNDPKQLGDYGFIFNEHDRSNKQISRGYDDEGSASRFFYTAKTSNKDTLDRTPTGRFPANVIHDGSEEVTQGFPDVNGATSRTATKPSNASSYVLGGDANTPIYDDGDNTSASRFFYTAKTSKKDRDDGLNGFGGGIRVRQGLDGEHKNTFGRNIHPTVKPTDLMQYLIRLIAAPNATILDMFMGSGSTGKAAMIENAERNSNYYFIGIDRTAEYLPIAQARIEFGLHYVTEKPKADGVVHQEQIDMFTYLEHVI